jgi:hypothetical protein
MGKANFFLRTLLFNPWADMAACRSSLENTRKINLKPILNKTSPSAHTESEFEVFGVLGKLVKYIVHLSKRKNCKIII